jgi:hypothetical protein
VVTKRGPPVFNLNIVAEQPVTTTSPTLKLRRVESLLRHLSRNKGKILLFQSSTIRRDASRDVPVGTPARGTLALQLVPLALAIWEIAPGVCLFLKEPDVMNGLAVTASTRLNFGQGESASRVASGISCPRNRQ